MELMKHILLILTAALLTSCTAPVAPPKPSEPVRVGITINRKPYEVTDGTAINYRGADGRYTKLQVVMP